MKALNSPLSLAMLVAGLLAATTIVPVVAQAASGQVSAPAADAHGHGHGASAPQLKLDHGRKWASDVPLRQGMTRIRDAVDAKLPAVHRGKMSAAEYDSLGREIDLQVAGIVRECKLGADADEVLHAILAGLIEGNELVQGKGANAGRQAGVVKVVQALEQYGEYFEHPGWKPPRADH